MEFNFASTPVKRIRFRGDSLQSDGEPLLPTDFDDDTTFKRNGDAPKEGLFTIFFMTDVDLCAPYWMLGDTQSHSHKNC